MKFLRLVNIEETKNLEQFGVPKWRMPLEWGCQKSNFLTTHLDFVFYKFIQSNRITIL